MPASTGIVEFSFANWIARYPEFSQTIGEDLAKLLFSEAGLYLNNTASSPVRDASDTGQRAILLGMVVAHLAQLGYGSSITPVTPMVGRILGASQGSVSVQSQASVPGGSAEWFALTKYGFNFWQASKSFKLGGRYHRGQQPYLGPYAGRYGYDFYYTGNGR